MKTKRMYLGVLVTCLAIFGIGCERTSTDRQALYGSWECTELSKIEHVSQFAKMIMNIRKDGIVESYMVDHHGKDVQRLVERVRVDHDILDFGEGGSRFRFSFRENVLVLTVIGAVAPEDVGNTLEFHRRT